jgi:hypothetical protein
VVRDRTLRAIVATAMVCTFATAFSMTAEIPPGFEHGGGALALGLLTACWGGGMVGGSWFAGRALHEGNEATGILADRLVMATAIGLVGMAPRSRRCSRCTRLADSAAVSWALPRSR